MFTCAGWIELANSGEGGFFDYPAPTEAAEIISQLVASTQNPPRFYTVQSTNYSTFLHIAEAHNHDSLGRRREQVQGFLSAVCEVFDESNGAVHFYNDEWPEDKAASVWYVRRGVISLEATLPFDPPDSDKWR